jgi:hypothetical protein
VFHGNFKNGIRTGDGKLKFHDGRKYEGNYENNQVAML